MKNPYSIISKQPNQSWEQWECNRKENEKISVPYNWKFDKARKVMKRYKKKGFCKQVKGFSGMDNFEWVGK